MGQEKCSCEFVGFLSYVVLLTAFFTEVSCKATFHKKIHNMQVFLFTPRAKHRTHGELAHERRYTIETTSALLCFLHMRVYQIKQCLQWHKNSYFQDESMQLFGVFFEGGLLCLPSSALDCAGSLLDRDENHLPSVQLDSTQ